MNAQRTKQLERLRDLASEIENELETLWEEVDTACDNLEYNDMEHLPVHDQLETDRANIVDAQESVADLWQALEAAING